MKLERTQKQFRDKIRSSCADEVKFDIQVDDANTDSKCRARITFSLDKGSTFIGWIDWIVLPLQCFVIDWEFKSSADIGK